MAEQAASTKRDHSEEIGLRPIVRLGGSRRERRRALYHKGLKQVLIGAAFLLLMVAVYLAAVTLQPPVDPMEGSFVVLDEAEPVTRMQPASSTDIHALATLFGAPLAGLRESLLLGQAGNTTHDGEPVRIVTLQYPQAVVTAVRPAGAAPLLMRGDMSVSLRSYQNILSLPAMEAVKDDAVCLYFSNESAAYSVYAEQSSAEEIMHLLTWVY